MRTVEEIKKDIENYKINKRPNDGSEIEVYALQKELCHTLIGKISLDRLEEICNAERKGRCVTLPCNVGDTVYLIVHGYVEETKVRTFFFGHPSYNRGEPDSRYEMIRCTNFDLPMKDFGKTVFLTREDAEKALKEGTE